MKTQATAYRAVSVNTADPGKLVLLLYEGAIRYLGIAIEKIDKGQMEESHNFLVRGKSIIAELMASLNMQKGNEIATSLQALYGYMYDRLIDANLRKDREIVQEVLSLLKTLFDGWSKINQKSKQNGKKTPPELQRKTELNVSV